MKKKRRVSISEEGLLRRLLGTRTEVDVALLDELQQEFLGHIQGTHDPDEADARMLESLTSLTVAVKYQPGDAAENARNLRARLRGIYDRIPEYHGELRRHVYFFTKEALLAEIIEDWGRAVNPDGMVAIRFFERQLSQLDAKSDQEDRHWYGNTRRMLVRVIVDHLKEMPAPVLTRWVENCSHIELLQRIGLARVFNGGETTVRADAYHEALLGTAAHMRFSPAVHSRMSASIETYARVQRAIDHFGRWLAERKLDAITVTDVDLAARTISMKHILRVIDLDEYADVTRMVGEKVTNSFQALEDWTAFVEFTYPDRRSPIKKELRLGERPF